MYYCMHVASKSATAVVVSSDKRRDRRLQCVGRCEHVIDVCLAWQQHIQHHQGASVVCKSPASKLST